MIDIHCHILPGVDDGPSLINESIEMCRIASEDGIKTVVATPHFRPGTYECDDVVSNVNALQQAATVHGISIQLLPGADVCVTPEMVFHVEEDRRLTINCTGRYVLAELPHEAVPTGWDRYLLSLRERGVTPILTHPERNPWFLNHRDALLPFVIGGGLVQITAMSITGEIGKDVREYCRFLIDQNLVHVIATDAHSVDQRPPVLSEAVRAAASLVGEINALRYVQDNPLAIIEGRSFEVPEPIMKMRDKKKWYQRILDL